MKYLNLFLLVSILSGCASTANLSLVDVEKLGNKFQQKKGEISPRAKIFLFAGESDVANFAQEILDQQSHWIRQGYSKEEVVCYYVKPAFEDIAKDYTQWSQIQMALSDCYPSSVALLWNHLNFVSKQGFKDSIYIYFTSHGSPPVSLSDAFKNPKTYYDLDVVNLYKKYPFLNQTRLDVRGLPDGDVADNRMIIGAIRRGLDPLNAFLTPLSLKSRLGELFHVNPKYVVIQGCYSGGFLESELPTLAKHSLKNLNNITVLTASKSNRASFGCEPGARETYFGNSYLRALKNNPGTITEINWDLLSKETRVFVNELEDDQVISENIRSEPLYFSNNK